jgi:hypothetical protein
LGVRRSREEREFEAAFGSAAFAGFPCDGEGLGGFPFGGEETGDMSAALADVLGEVACGGEGAGASMQFLGGFALALGEGSGGGAALGRGEGSIEAGPGEEGSGAAFFRCREGEVDTGAAAEALAHLGACLLELVEGPGGEAIEQGIAPLWFAQLAGLVEGSLLAFRGGSGEGEAGRGDGEPAAPFEGGGGGGALEGEQLDAGGAIPAATGLVELLEEGLGGGLPRHEIEEVDRASTGGGVARFAGFLIHREGAFEGSGVGRARAISGLFPQDAGALLPEPQQQAVGLNSGGAALLGQVEGAPFHARCGLLISGEHRAFPEQAGQVPAGRGISVGASAPELVGAVRWGQLGVYLLECKFAEGTAGARVRAHAPPPERRQGLGG